MSDKKGLGGLNLTKGTYEFVGVVFGTQKEKFYESKMTKTNKPFRSLRFGLQVSHDWAFFVNLTGMEQEKVYFSKISGGKERKVEVVSESWDKRYMPQDKGFRLIGVNLGLQGDVKKLEWVTKTPFDACEYLSTNLKDGMSVFVKGNVDYSHYETQGGTVINAVKFIPTQIKLVDQVNFNPKDTNGNDLKYVPTSAFNQMLVYTDIHKGKSNNGEYEEYFYLDAKIVNYNSIENAQFIIEDSVLAGNFKNKLKPYTLIDVWGDIRSLRITEPVEDNSDGWGTPNPMDRLNSSYTNLLVIKGANPNNINSESHSSDAIDKAVKVMNSSEKANKDFGADEWGMPTTTSSEKDELPW